MPLYEYECEACGQRFEVIQKFSDPPVEHCRTCGGPVHKLLSSAAIQFKGSGWYVTDYSGSRSQCTSGGTGEGDKPAAGSESSPAAETAKTETPAPPKKFT